MDPDKLAQNEKPIAYYRDLEPSLRRRVRNTYIIAAVWAGLVLGSAGVFAALMPWMDKQREERLKERKQRLNEQQSNIQQQSQESKITNKIEELNIKASAKTT